jgi:hypothetical protein
MYKKMGAYMRYKEKVEEKIKESNIRTKERLKIWQIICDDYEKGGVEEVKLSIDEFANKIKSKFDEIISKIEQML